MPASARQGYTKHLPFGTRHEEIDVEDAAAAEEEGDDTQQLPSFRKVEVGSSAALPRLMGEIAHETRARTITRTAALARI